MMAYCVDSDVRLHAPQAPTGAVLTGYIAQADRVIDAHLRVVYDVPFASTPDLITNISSKLAAAEYLKAKYAALSKEVPAQANTLFDEAMAMLREIKNDPNMLDVAIKNPETEDYDRNDIMTTDATHGEAVFNMHDERFWG